VAYELDHGDLEPGSVHHESSSYEVHHRCGNRLCIAGNHLCQLTRNRHAKEHRAMRTESRHLEAA
jgi:hypothetical protein